MCDYLNNRTYFIIIKTVLLQFFVSRFKVVKLVHGFWHHILASIVFFKVIGVKLNPSTPSEYSIRNGNNINRIIPLSIWITIYAIKDFILEIFSKFFGTGNKTGVKINEVADLVNTDKLMAIDVIGQRVIVIGYRLYS